RLSSPPIVAAGLPDAAIQSQNQEQTPAAPVDQAKLQEAYGRLPLTFEANHGQTDAQVQFLSRGNGYTLFLTGNEAVFDLRKPDGADNNTAEQSSTANVAGLSEAAYTVVRMQLVGANATPQAVGQDELPGKVNYFLGNDPSKWQTNVATFAKVRYQQVYDGV